MVPCSRRRFLQSSLAASVTGVAGCVFNPTGGSGCTEGRTLHDSDVSLDQAAAWPMYQYDAANTGHNPDASGPKTAGEITWRYSACTEADTEAVIHGGRAYAGGLVVSGRTGERIGGTWGGGRGTPAVVDGTMYVSATDLEAQNATTGESLWTFQTEGDMGVLLAVELPCDLAASDRQSLRLRHPLEERVLDVRMSSTLIPPPRHVDLLVYHGS